MLTPYTILIIAVALAFDCINGAHDAANSVATLVATKVFKKKWQAVAWAAFFNFLAFAFLGTAVAKAIGKGIIHADAITPTVILTGLLAAIAWNLFTWWRGIPSSSSHALMGGLAGAAIIHAGGTSALIWGGWLKPFIFIFAAPLIGGLLSLFFVKVLNFFLRKVQPEKVDKYSRGFQLFSAAAFSFGHGGNDAQKTMGVITGLLVSVGYLHDFKVPWLVVVGAHLAIALGTMIGAWKIINTLAHKITTKDMRPHEGVCAETAAALCILPATFSGIPLSTTHTITGAITGIGLSKGKKEIHMKKILEIFAAWVATMFAAAIISAGIYSLIS